MDAGNIRALADLLDFISSGALTHSAPILDLSLKHLRLLDGNTNARERRRHHGRARGGQGARFGQRTCPRGWREPSDRFRILPCCAPMGIDVVATNRGYVLQEAPSSPRRAHASWLRCATAWKQAGDELRVSSTRVAPCLT